MAALSAATLIINVLWEASLQSSSQDANHEAQRHHHLSTICNKDVRSKYDSEIDELQMCCQCMYLTKTSDTQI